MSDYTVKDLIEILREYSPEAIVCVRANDATDTIQNFSVIAIEEDNRTYVSTDDTMHEDNLVILIID